MYQLAEIVKDACKTHGEKVAVRFYKDGFLKTISYHHFNEAAHLLSGILKEIQCNFEIVTHNYIAILVDVSDIYPVIIQGILLSGSPFVCLDVDGSKGDLANLIEKLKIQILLTNEKHADKISTNFDESEKLKDYELFESACQIWKTGIVKYGCNNDDYLNKRLLYAIQTSGSTGEKKIVQVTEDCILPNILELRDLFELSTADVIYYGSPITFDPNIIELFLALTSGASLCIVSSKARAATVPVLVDVLFPEKSENDDLSNVENSENVDLSGNDGWCVIVFEWYC
ncbi:hypothetical protein LSTR_LSTR004524 [Laodelphax striatellus]|uniref:AMP-dependent synthetase/ligase domain-containing protein n=1 Tax=Laodelphax striatellus TaxID=195883 RepID=A0A482XHB3_LAOST|nr:hypothetical protein LSTR_LSTR004524 [Laodelphax striatellus]